MGLSRNKVAVSEGAAGSPPFYGERGSDRKDAFPKCHLIDEPKKEEERLRYFYCSILKDRMNKKKFIVKRNLQTQTLKDGGVAQLGEHLPCKQGVRGSIPLISIGYGGL